MADQRSPPSCGKGRTIFVARLETIRSEIGKGLLLTTIYDRHKAALGIGYAGFCKLVARYADDANPLQPRPVLAAAQAFSRALPASPAPLTPEACAHARHEPAARSDFKHHGIVQEGEPEQLFGPGFLPKRPVRPLYKVHTVLAPKGGCGKTYVASLITQNLLKRGEPGVCFDTDRENASLCDIPAPKAEPVSLFLSNSDESTLPGTPGLQLDTATQSWRQSCMVNDGCWSRHAIRSGPGCLR